MVFQTTTYSDSLKPEAAVEDPDTRAPHLKTEPAVCWPSIPSSRTHVSEGPFISEVVLIS